MNRLELFLKELAELTIKYGFAIDGCECDGSPYLIDSEKEFEADCLHFNKEEKRYHLYWERISLEEDKG